MPHARAAPPFPANIVSRNITPHANGIAGWTATDVRNALKNGVDKAGVPTRVAT